VSPGGADGRWTVIHDLFHRALEQPADQRAAFLDAACGADSGLREEVASLLAAHERAGAFLEQPAAASTALRDTMAPPGDSPMPQTIGPYRVERVLGEGGMGIVYLAEDTRLGRLVALKAVAARFAADAQRRERLRREARAAAALTHSGIATIFALEEIDGHLYIASEYVPGETLRDELQRGPLPIASAIATAAAIARALAAAHDAGIIHRDLKPENVIRTPGGDVKVLDFGLARFRAGEPEGPALTGDGTILGTPAYMSPEQLRASVVDQRSDLFAFGVVLYELVSGVHPFAGSDSASTIARILETEPPRLSIAGASGREAALVGALEPIVLTLLRKAPVARFRSAHEVVQALTRLESGGSAAVSAPLEPLASVDAGGSRWWWQFHQAAAIVAYLALLVPLWLVRPVAGRWGMLQFVLGVVAVTAATIIRWHLWFTLRSYPSEWRRQRAESAPWLRAADLLFVLVLAVAGFMALEAEKTLAIVLIVAAVAALMSSTIIEPATTRAAFDTTTADPRN
jgi:serine/threonine protein kinase